MRWLALAALLSGATLAAGQTPDPHGPRGPSPGGGMSDWERKQGLRGAPDADVMLPGPPKGELIEFFVSAASSFKFFIDPKSLSVGGDGVVRYTLVARSRSGAQNVSYEGIRCEDGTYKVYALGNDGSWIVRPGEWRRIEGRSVQRWHNELYLRFFCVDGLILRNAEEGINALRRGARPDFNNAERAN